MLELRSKIAIKLLGYYFLNPGRKHYINELAVILEVDPGNLYRKLKEMEIEGILISETRGNQKYYSLNTGYSLLKETKRSFEAKYGFVEGLKKELQKLKGVKEAYIFGSYAKGALQAESDIDLLLVGSHNAIDARRILLTFQKKAGREINIVDFSEAEFQKRKKKKDEFIENILTGKNIKLI